jgi:hypothetical protein
LEAFDRKYAGSWITALPDACRVLLDLNRYAKHESCRIANRDEIYHLKSGIIWVLYSNGFCIDCYLHKSELPPKTCWTCGGMGMWESWRGSRYEECRRCDGTGVYRGATTLTFVCFRFSIGGTTYCWHQPRESVDFTFQVTGVESTFTLTTDEKPISLNPQKFEGAKDLLRWVIEEAAAKAAKAA